jgi:hypothetical protein
MKKLKWFSGVLFAGLALTACSNNEETATESSAAVAGLRDLLVKDGAPIGYVNPDGSPTASTLFLPEGVQAGRAELVAFFEAQLQKAIPGATFTDAGETVSYVLPERAGVVSLKFSNVEGTSDENGVHASIHVGVPAIKEVTQIDVRAFDANGTDGYNNYGFSQKGW